MNVYEIQHIDRLLEHNAYAGRGIVIGTSADGKKTLLTLDANGGKLTAGNTTDLTWKVLAGDTVEVANKIDSTELGTLTFNAYLVQAGGFDSAAAAWNAAKLVSGLDARA